MPIPDPASRQRLAVLGIDVWVRRDRVVLPADEVVSEYTASTPAGAELRVRMASGSGEWLLVQRDPWSGSHERLLADITATIGAARCRFGQWAVSESAGLALGELNERGIRHVIAFGEPPRSTGNATVHLAPTLEALASDGRARRQLWQILSELLER